MTDEELRQRRHKNRVLAAILVGFAALTFLVTVVKLQNFAP